MPMQKISTLMYCYNSFRSDCEQCETTIAENELNAVETSIGMEPSETSIKNILNFARSYDVLETESAGYVEMILN